MIEDRRQDSDLIINKPTNFQSGYQVGSVSQVGISYTCIRTYIFFGKLARTLPLAATAALVLRASEELQALLDLGVALLRGQLLERLQ